MGYETARIEENEEPNLISERRWICNTRRGRERDISSRRPGNKESRKHLHTSS